MEEIRENTSILETVKEYTRIFIIVFLIIFALNKLVYINAVIPSESMQDTILKGDRIIGNRLAYMWNDPERFDIVIFKYPDNPSEIFIKRVIGLPGEIVEVKAGKVYINGSEEPLDDSFCPEDPEGDFGPYQVPEDCYFMMGDNRNNSLDSRYWKNHYVEKEAILAKASFRYWPFSRVEFVK